MSVEDARVVTPAERIVGINVEQYLVVAEGLAGMTKNLLTNASKRRARAHAPNA